MKNCFYPADILLPEFAGDAGKMNKWACIACDQYTSQESYWKEVEKTVADEPSAYKLIIPEIYLADSEKMLPEINAGMEDYLKNVLCEHKDSVIYIERTLKCGKVRRGIIGAVDLECYDWRKGASSPIRATEGTVAERIPPRVRVRREAAIELPHIMLLIDDAARTVIEPLEAQVEKFVKAYDFTLMQNGGSIKGYFLTDEAKTQIDNALSQLGEGGLLFAVGDGNHSLATAKELYEEIKKNNPEAALSHPARYALCEIVNIHDESLDFEPIYRVLFNADTEDVISGLRKYAAELSPNDTPSQTVEFVTENGNGKIVFENPSSQLPVGTLQNFLDAYLSEHTGVKIDYIHGADAARSLAMKKNVIGFIFEGMQKNQLFNSVICDGALPRKTFSMGEADDKRFYLEARKIR